MAHLLAKLGKEALLPQKVGAVWHKAKLSARVVARLRKEALAEGREWEYEEPRPPRSDRPVWQKGKKVDRLKAKRDADVAEKLAGADAAIAAHRAARREAALKASPIDLLLLTKKQLRAKAKGG